MPKIFSRVLTFLPVILLLLLSFFAVRPLLAPGYFSMHDDQQIARLFELDKSLSVGQFPVRWVEGLGFGYGYPLFNFYPPLTYYLGEAYHLVLQTGFIDSTKLVWFTALAGSAIAMYFLSKEFFGKVGGVISALFYLYAPYHAVDAYVRGALAELFSFVWLPLILLFSYKNKPLVTGVLLGLLMITHNLIFLPFVGIFILWSLAFRKNFIIGSLKTPGYQPGDESELIKTSAKGSSFPVDVGVFVSLIKLPLRKLRFLKPEKFIIPIIIAFGLTAFFWLPALWEKQFTLVDQLLIKNLASYQIHFLCPLQLWYGPWGFGGSVSGCADGLSFALGKIYFLAIAAGLIFAIAKKSRVGLVSFFLLTFSLFMTLPYSQFIWDKIPQLWYLQFPWRFLEFAVLFSALLAGSLNKKLLALLLVPLVIFINAKYFVPQKFSPNATDQQLTSDVEIKWHISSTSFEFMSRDVATKLTDKGIVWVDIDETKIQDTRYKIQNGDWQTTQENFSPGKFFLSGSSRQGATLQFQISNFPGWQLWLDNKPVTIDDNNKYRLLSLAVPAGEHNISGRFTNTLARIAGNTISLAFIVLSFGLALYYGTNRTRS